MEPEVDRCGVDGTRPTREQLAWPRPLSPSVVRPAPWSVDFELPASVRVGEEVVVDVHLRNGQSNCSQVGRVPSTPQRSTSGSMTFHD